MKNKKVDIFEANIRVAIAFRIALFSSDNFQNQDFWERKRADRGAWCSAEKNAEMVTTHIVGP